MSRMDRLKVYKRSTSRSRSIASCAVCLALSERRLATSAVIRKLNKATQFFGSWMVNVRVGSKKKKFRVKVAAIDATEASTNPQALAVPSTTSRYPKLAVVAFTESREYPAYVTPATAAIDDKQRITRRIKVYGATLGSEM